MKNIFTNTLTIILTLLFTLNISAQQTAEDFSELGRQQYYKDDKEGAIRSFSECIKLDPNNLYCYSRRAALYEQKKDYAGAIADYTQAIRIKPEDNGGYAHRAEIYYKDLKNYDAAIADYLMDLKLLSGESTYALIADVYADKKDYDNALSNISQAIRLNPNVYYYYTARAKFYEAKKEYAKAAEDYSDAIVLDSGSGSSYYPQRAKVYCLLGETALAAADEQKARSLGSGEIETCNLPTAQIKTAANKKPADKLVVLSEAERILKLQKLNESNYYRSLNEAANQPEPSVYRGQALSKYIDSLENSHRTEAERSQIILSKLKELAEIDFYAAFTAVISTNNQAPILAAARQLPPDQSAALRQLGGWYTANYDLAYANKPKNPYPANLPQPGFGWGRTVSSNTPPKIAADSPSKTPMIDAAMAAATSPAKAAPVDAAVKAKTDQLIKLSTEQMKSNNRAGALRSLNECLAIDPSDVFCHSLRGNIYIITAEYDKAQADLDEAIRLDPGYDGFYFTRGLFYKIRKNWAAALQDLSKAIALAEGYKESQPDYYSERSVSYINLNRFSEALTDINKALTLAPGNPSYYFQRGLINYSLNNKPAAIADYRKTLQLNPQFEQARKSLSVLGVEP